jgi:DNA-binding transcriptional MerR regulator
MKRDQDFGAAMQSAFTIGDLANEFGLTLRTLRFYEDKGLIHPRRDGLSRLYSRRDRARLTLIMLGRKVGFSLNEIKQMLDLYELRDGSPTRLRAALSQFASQIEKLRRHREDVEQAIEKLEHTMKVVADMLDARERDTREPNLSEMLLEAAE